MCTVTFIPTSEGVYLTSNRDEHCDRRRAFPPEMHHINGQVVTYPKDPQAGGTWIVLRENGAAAVLLNGGFERHARRPAYRKSRGLVMLEIAGAANAVAYFQDIDLDAIEPFTLILFSNSTLHHCTWDGDRKHISELNAAQPHIWSSATLYDRSIQFRREYHLKKWLTKTKKPTRDAILDFHLHPNLRYETSGNQALSKIKTVSVTSLEIPAAAPAGIMYHDQLSSKFSRDRPRTSAASKSRSSESFSWKVRRFFIRLRHWEYWPMACIYLPLVPFWIWLSLRARSFWFFSAANPGIQYSGFIQERKSDIYPLLPEGTYPRTMLCKPGLDLGQVHASLRSYALTFPLIAKPDIGERGIGVKLLRTFDELEEYRSRSKVDFLLQEYVDYPCEIGVFYHRIPGDVSGQISGIVGKEFLSVTGDGKSDLLTLIKQNDRACLQFPAMAETFGDQLETVLPAGEKLDLVPYGNHSRGAKFIDLRERITPELTHLMNEICTQIPGFDFGRLDIRFKSWEELQAGKHFSIIEVNGTGSEPTHIYDPAHSILFAWKEIYRHWKIVFRISLLNSRSGRQRLMTWREGRAMKKAHDKHLMLMRVK